MPRSAIAKSDATRSRILDAALALFAEKGYAGTTLREIATLAEVSPGLTYRYFASKDALVLELYGRLVDELVEEAGRLEPGTLASRWLSLTRNDLARMAPHRETLSGLFAAGLTPGSPTQILGETVAPLRARLVSIFETLVVGSRDAPRGETASHLPVLLYAAHLLLVLFWLQDSTPNQKSTDRLCVFASENIARLRLILKLPFASRALRELAEIVGPMFGRGDGAVS